jgi:hypothetical protein
VDQANKARTKQQQAITMDPKSKSMSREKLTRAAAPLESPEKRTGKGRNEADLKRKRRGG